MQNLDIGIPLNHKITNSNLNHPSIPRNPTANTRHNSYLNKLSETCSRLSNESNIWRATTGEIRWCELVQPENTGNAAGAIVYSKAEELVRFQVSAGDNADCFGTGEGGGSVMAGEGGGIRGVRCESEEVEGQELDVGGW